MSIIAMARVLKSRVGSTSKKAVLLAMADAANDDGSGIWKSAETISEQSEVSRRTVFRSWSEMEAEGILSRDGERRVKGGSVIIWKINLDALLSIKPDAAASLGEDEKPGDGVSPSETDDTNPVTILHKPGDTASPNPSLNLKIEPSLTACSAENEFEKAWKLYQTAPLKARQTKKLAEAAWRIACKKNAPAMILAAIRAEIDDQHRKRTAKAFAPSLPDMHRWLKQERWNDIVGIPEGTATDGSTDWLEFSFRMLAQNGDWPGAQYGFPVDPRGPEADYPAALYDRHGIKRFVSAGGISR